MKFPAVPMNGLEYEGKVKLKLFGNKKSGKDAANAATINSSEEIPEKIEQEVLHEEVPVSETAIPEITVVKDIVLPDEKEEETISAEAEKEEKPPLVGEEGYIHSIAETFGISAEEMQKEASGDAAVTNEGGDKKQKMTRAEKKDAKKAAKAAFLLFVYTCIFAAEILNSVYACHKISNICIINNRTVEILAAVAHCICGNVYVSVIS